MKHYVIIFTGIHKTGLWHPNTLSWKTWILDYQIKTNKTLSWKKYITIIQEEEWLVWRKCCTWWSNTKSFIQIWYLRTIQQGSLKSVQGLIWLILIVNIYMTTLEMKSMFFFTHQFRQAKITNKRQMGDKDILILHGSQDSPISMDKISMFSLIPQ